MIDLKLGAIYHLAATSDGKMIAAGGVSPDIRLIRLDSRNQYTTTILKGHTEPINGMRFDTAGTLLVSSSNDKTVRIWDVATSSEILCIEDHTRRVNDAVFSPDGSLIATASHDNSIRLFNSKSGNPVAVLNGHQSWVWSVSFSPNGKSLASIGNDKTVRLWNLGSFQETGTISVGTGWDTGLVFTHDSRMVVVANLTSIKFFNAENCELVTALEGPSGLVTELDITPDGSLLASGTTDGTVRLWKVPE